MDYYSTLGLQRNASADEIKQAYRKLAMKHHPDRGGDQNKFKELSAAYDALNDPEKKRIIDSGGDPNSQPRQRHQDGNPFEFHFNSGNMDDIFSNFGFGRQPQQKNKTLSVNVNIALEDVLTGKEFTAEIKGPDNKGKIITIQIPAGIEAGQQVRYEGMGDHSIPSLRPGDLIVNVQVLPHAKFTREGSSLLIEQEISVWDALVGSSVEIITLDKKKLAIKIPAGTQPSTVLRIPGEGLPNMRTRQRGNMMLEIKIVIPKNLTVTQIKQINQIKTGN